MPVKNQIQWITNPPQHLVCSKVPGTIDANAGFVVPVSLLDDINDIFAAAELGAWETTSSGSRHYEINVEGKTVVRHKTVTREGDDSCFTAKEGNRAGSKTRVVDDKDIIWIRRRTSTLKSLPSYNRSIFMGFDINGKPLDYLIVHYFFEGIRQDLPCPLPHGNSKSRTAVYSQVKQSKMKTMKQQVRNDKPRSVYKSNSGSASSDISLSAESRNLQQIYNLNRSNSKSDEIQEVILQHINGLRDVNGELLLLCVTYF